jgi:adenosine deaminase
MDLRTFLRKIPKVELHCHLQGTVRATTLVEIAAKHKVTLPPYDQPEELYERDTTRIPSVGPGFRLAPRLLRDRDDYHRVTYEILASGAANGLRYLEPFGDPGTGASHQVALDGMIAGMRDAEADYGVQCRLVPGLSRMETPPKNVAMLQSVIDHRRDEIIGIGMGGAELGGPPEWFVEAFRLAASAGLHRTCHAAEEGPPINVQTCLDVLGCERIDHGYHVIEDDQITQRCVDEQVCFTVCPTITEQAYGWTHPPQNPIRAMAQRGLKIMINTDDPGNFPTDLGREYIVMAEHLGFTVAELKRFVLNGIDGSWLDDSTKRQWRQEWSREIDDLIAQLN